jgi:hypothetical protein
MEAQKLLNAAPYGPETVQVLKQVLDEAWASISSTTAVGLVENTRLSLAHAIVAHAASGGIDREALKAAALDAIHKHPPRVSPDQRPITGKIKRKRAR